MRTSSFETVLIFALLAYLCLIMFPLYTLERPPILADFEDPETVNARWNMAAIFLIACADLLFLNRFVALAWRAYRGSREISAFINLMLCGGILGAFTVGPLVIFNACIAILVIANWSIFWSFSKRARARFWRYGAYLIAAFLILSVIIHGPPVGRWIGGIHPNILGGFGLALCSFAVIMTGRFRAPLFCIGITASLAVSSRYALVGSVIVLFSVLFWKNLSESRYTRLLLVAGAVISLLGLTFGWDTIADILQLQNADRGIGSGLGGRIESWQEFWPQFREVWFAGHGFRNRDAYIGTHNGYLNTLIELGAFVGGGLILLIACRLVRIFTWAARDRGREAIGASSALIGILTVAFLQPQIINFGDAFGYTAVMLLSIPLMKARGSRPIRMNPARPTQENYEFRWQRRITRP